MTLTLPFPPSTNTAYANVRGRRVKTKKAREYAAAVHQRCTFAPWATVWEIKSEADDIGRLAVRLDLHPPTNHRRDVGNYEKLAVDAVFTYLGIDDSLIDDLRIVRHAVEKPGRLVMTITEIAGEAS